MNKQNKNCFFIYLFKKCRTRGTCLKVDCSNNAEGNWAIKQNVKTCTASESLSNTSTPALSSRKCGFAEKPACMDV